MKNKQKTQNVTSETELTQTNVVADETTGTSSETAEIVVEDNGSKKPNKVINTVINVVLIVAIVIAAICTYVSFVTTSGNGVPSIFGLRLLSIQTDSMYPAIHSGDLIIDTAVKDPADLRKNDVITFWTVINGERVLNTHRIENIYDGGDYLIFETKGDANKQVDPLTVHESELVGKYKFRIPGIGKVFDYLQETEGFLIIVVIPVLIFFIYHLIQFFRVLFEYQNIKNRIKFEQEQNQREDDTKEKESAASKEAERAAIEAELREKLKAELLESMKAEAEAAKAKTSESDVVTEPESVAAENKED